ncbi:hypothetical protein FACS189449_10530 [Alphaproteobacteria bacterium]|nr:hypothetical protein FACS189449_10530 [Alphaproteobacteria bacterium]
MRIDIIVPTFDASSYEVTLTVWYKKVGEKISKNEIIADAETSMIACGITSSYDCILAKIIAKEGAVIPQGSRIAIIETDVNADMSRIVEEIEAEELLRKSNDIAKEILEDQRRVAASNAKSKEEQEYKQELAHENSRKSKALRNSTTEGVGEEYHEDEPSGEYLLSVNGAGESLVGKAAPVSLFSPFADSIIEELQETEEIRDTVLEALHEDTEERVKNIIETTRNKAKDEAKTLREKILEEAKKVALQQAEELKLKILLEYEEKATKDASEARDKIVRGSVLEAENTRNSIINDIKERAKKEAEAIKAELIKNAEEEAEDKAKEIRKEVIAKAKQKAREEAENVAKEIVEEAIHEAKSEAKAIKKEILHSAQKFAAKETESIMKEFKKTSQKILEEEDEIIETEKRIAEAKFIGENIVQSANVEAETLRQRVLDSANVEAETLRQRILDMSNSEAEILRQRTLESANTEADILRQRILDISNSEAEILRQRTLESAYAEADILKNEILSFTKRELSSVLNNIKAEANLEIKNTIAEVVSTVKTEASEKLKNTCKVAIEKIDEEIAKETTFKKNFIEERIENLESTREIVRKLLNTPLEDFAPEMIAETWKKPTFFSSPGDETVPIDFLKQRINEKLRSSMDSSVISTVSNEVDMSAVLIIEKTFGKEFAKKYNTRLGFTPFFILASISALKEYKMFNAHIHKDDLIYKNSFDISVITCGNDGIAAPVIRNADALSIADIEKSMIALSRRAVEGTLSLEEVSGGTFTVVNAGVYGSLMGTDLLTPPQVATLSVHRMHDRPIAVDTGVEVRPMLYISLSYDHRVADTKIASEFLISIRKYVENPGWTLLGL